MTRAHRPTRRIAALAAACVGAALALTACIDVNADLTVNADATASGTFEMVLQKQAATMLGVTSADQLGEQIAAENSGGIANMTDCTSSETDAGFAYSCSFTDMAFTATDDPWTITKNGDELVFAMKGNAAAGATGDAGDAGDLLGDASLGTMTVTVTFPGPISAVTGEGVTQTENSATISSDLSKATDVTITASAGSSGLSASIIVVILIAVAVLVLIVVVAIVLISRRRKPGGPPIAAPGIANAEHVVAGATATTALTTAASEVAAETVAEAEAAVAEATPTPETPETPAAPSTPETPETPDETTNP